MDTKEEAKKYLNKYFKAQYLKEEDAEFKALVRLLNKARYGRHNKEFADWDEQIMKNFAEATPINQFVLKKRKATFKPDFNNL